METYMEEDDESTDGPSLPKPVLQTHASDQLNLITCTICNIPVDKKNVKRRGISLIQKKEVFKTYAIL